MAKREISGILFTPLRQVFKKLEPEKVAPPPGIAEGAEVKTLQDALDEANELIIKTETRLDEIRKWYSENGIKIPAKTEEDKQLRRTIKEEFKKCEELLKKVKEYRDILTVKGWEGERKREFRDEEGIRTETISRIDKVFTDFWIFHKEKVEEPLIAKEEEEEARHKGDPMYGNLTTSLPRLSFKEKPISKKKPSAEESAAIEDVSAADEEAVPVENPKYKLEDERRAPGESDPAYSGRLYRNIVRILIKQAETGETTRLSAPERSAIMVMKKGETNYVKVDGQKYALEKENLGRFIRLRDYPGDSGDPVIALNEGVELPSSWRSSAKKEIARREFLKSFENNWMELADETTPPGSKLLIGERVSDGDPFPLEITLQKNRLFRVSRLEKRTSVTPEGQTKTGWEFKKSVMNAENLTKLLNEAAEDALPSEFHAATEEERLAEEDRYKKEQTDKLAKLAYDASEAFTHEKLLGKRDPGFNAEDKFKDIRELLAANPDIDFTDFESKPFGGYSVIMKDGQPVIAKELSTRKGKTRYAILYPEPAGKITRIARKPDITGEAEESSV